MTVAHGFRPDLCSLLPTCCVCRSGFFTSHRRGTYRNTTGAGTAMALQSFKAHRCFHPHHRPVHWAQTHVRCARSRAAHTPEVHAQWVHLPEALAAVLAACIVQGSAVQPAIAVSVLPGGVQSVVEAPSLLGGAAAPAGADYSRAPPQLPTQFAPLPELKMPNYSTVSMQSFPGTACTSVQAHVGMMGLALHAIAGIGSSP